PTVPHPLNGQSWNRYSYVLNSPLTFVDPLGLDGAPVTVVLCQNRPPAPGGTGTWHKDTWVENCVSWSSMSAFSTYWGMMFGCIGGMGSSFTCGVVDGPTSFLPIGSSKNHNDPHKKSYTEQGQTTGNTNNGVQGALPGIT